MRPRFEPATSRLQIRHYTYHKTSSAPNVPFWAKRRVPCSASAEQRGARLPWSPKRGGMAAVLHTLVAAATELYRGYHRMERARHDASLMMRLTGSRDQLASAAAVADRCVLSGGQPLKHGLLCRRNVIAVGEKSVV